MSGLKINFLKSEVLCVGGDDSVLQSMLSSLGVKLAITLEISGGTGELLLSEERVLGFCCRSIPQEL